MKILKFGGTSVGSIEGLSRVENIIKSCQGRKIVVCSAISGVTDILVDLVECVKVSDKDLIIDLLKILKTQHFNLVKDLSFDPEVKKTLFKFINNSLANIFELSKSEFCLNVEFEIITYGERLLTKIYSVYLNSIGIRNTLLDSKEFMIVYDLDNPNISLISDKLMPDLDKEKECELFITQGFIRINDNGEIRHLCRGGSDYTATLIGAAISADEVQIWSDIDGMRNNDPRYVESTTSIPYLSYDEAAELAYFGAKILHPKTIFPVKELQIPIHLKNTFDSKAIGTIINSTITKCGIKAISAKDNLMSISINSKYINGNFDIKVIDIFKRYNIPMYLHYESENQMEIILDQSLDIHLVIKELEKTISVKFEKNLCVVCLVGEESNEDIKSKNIEIIKTISYNNNVFSLGKLGLFALVKSKNKVQILRKLNSRFFLKEINKIIVDKN